MAVTPAPAAELLVAQLEAMEVEVVFGLPGVHNLAIFEALRRSPIRTIVVRHEQAAGYAADGYARATGRVGVCLTTTGPGAANTAAAMGEARASRSPVLHLSTQIETRLLEGRSGRGSLHESPEQRELMSAVCSWSGRVARAVAMPSMVVRAAEAAFGGRRGPAFLEIPHDLLSERVRTRIEEAPRLPRPIAPEPAAIRRAVAALRRGSRPVVWAGGGVISSGGAAALERLAEILDAPVITTFAGRGLIPPEHPLCVGLPPHQPQVTRLLAESDAILIAGSDLDGMNTQNWRLPLPRRRIAINTLAYDARRNYPAEVVVEADARLAFEALAAALGPSAPPDRRGGEPGDGRRARRAATPGARRVRATRRAALAALRRSREFSAPFAFVERLAGAVPPEATVLADMAVPGYWLAGYYPVPAPRRFAYPVGWGTLGFAFPASLGAAAADRPALAVAGDGGFLFAPGELATAVQERLPVRVLVVNDGGYGMLRFDQEERYGARFGVDLHTPDASAVARAFGCRARRVPLGDLEEALRWAFGRRGPALVEVAAAFAPPLTTSPRWPLRGQPEVRR